MKLVTSIDQVLANMERQTKEVAASPELANRFGLAHAWYIDARNPDRPLFGFSKFIGYEALDAATYLKEYKNLDGRNTEWALKGFCEEIRSGSPQFDEYHSKLTEWLSGFNKKPRNPVRLMVLKPELQEEIKPDDRRILELLTAVADMLPLDQRHELRSRL